MAAHAMTPTPPPGGEDPRASTEASTTCHAPLSLEEMPLHELEALLDTNPASLLRPLSVPYLTSVPPRLSSPQDAPPSTAIAPPHVPQPTPAPRPTSALRPTSAPRPTAAEAEAQRDARRVELSRLRSVEVDELRSLRLLFPPRLMRDGSQVAHGGKVSVEEVRVALARLWSALTEPQLEAILTRVDRTSSGMHDIV